jgi:AraC-like DNA-binding protein
MKPLAHGRIEIWQGGSLWVFQVPGDPGGIEATDFHAHHAIQVTLALDGEFELLGLDRRFCGPAFAVAADIRHAFRPKGLIALLFAEPESPQGRVIARTLLAEQPIAALPPALAARCADEIRRAVQAAETPGQPLADVGRALIEELAGGFEPPASDARIEDVVAWAAAHLDRQLSALQAARRVGLSVDRMSHLFVEHTGLPFRTYVLWLRMTRAVEAYAAGASLTEAAHDAGFADSAHFSRTFRRMFGVAAAALRLS